MVTVLTAALLTAGTALNVLSCPRPRATRLVVLQRHVLGAGARTTSRRSGDVSINK